MTRREVFFNKSSQQYVVSLGFYRWAFQSIRLQKLHSDSTGEAGCGG